MRILTNDDLNDLLTFPAIIAAVEQAMLDHDRNPDLAPQRLHLHQGANTLLVMPAFSDSYYGTKLVSVIPGNVALDLPVTNGAMLLHDGITGLPVALFNAAKLTALRTGALGAIGLKYTTPGNMDSLGLIGTGVQGLHQALFAPAVRPIRKLYCLKRSEAGFRQFRETFQAHYPDIPVIPCPTPEALLGQTSVIIAATSASKPVLPDNPELLLHKHFISIGSFKPDMQELPDAVYQLAGQVVLDSPGARQETGDVLNPLAKGLVLPNAVFPIAQLIAGARQVNVLETTVYKSAGMALFDLYVAREMWMVAEKKEVGQQVDF
ncbi:MAG: ornithine cyclodeaminase family protein [Bacteroidetes bacterium]|nr:MAG: ornithine cyclodeaminase family protein [Bacteroidota bacterium]